MKIIFLGSSKYSTIDEKLLHENFGLSLVVTLPDRENSKTKQLISNPVKQFAEQHTIPVITAEKLTPDIIDQITSYQPDFLVVADYGVILPQTLLDVPKIAAINVHHSLLPKYRGPAPVPFAILHGEQIVGVTVMQMSRKVDAGDILAQQTYTLLPTDTTDSVLIKLNQLGGQLAVDVLQNFDEYFAKKSVQKEDEATFTQYMNRQDGYIDIAHLPSWEKFDRMVRAYFPWPGVWTKTKLSGKERIIKFFPDQKIQVEGKNVVSYKDFLNGYPDAKEWLEKITKNSVN